jgi:hypothetical protein
MSFYLPAFHRVKENNEYSFMNRPLVVTGLIRLSCLDQAQTMLILSSTFVAFHKVKIN